MERIATLLEKIKELNNVPNPTLVEVDLMMDYTRVLYADLFEWRKKLAFNDAVTMKPEVKESAPAAPPAASIKVMPPTAEPVKMPSPPAPDIRQHIGINDKYQFISELFGNNKEAYEEVMSEINTFDTEEEAIAWLNNNVSNQYGWDDDGETVQAFYETLGGYFSRR